MYLQGHGDRYARANKMGKSGGLKSLKREKAQGPDGLLNEMMFGDRRMVKALVDFLNLMLWSECCLEDWMQSLVVPLYKDGDVEVIGNYRGM